MISKSGIISPGALKGVTANRNITAFSLAIKIPFVLFLLHLVTKRYIKALLTLIILLSLLCLTMIQSWASFVAIGIILIGYIIMYLLLYLKHRKRSFIFKIGFFVIPLSVAILINQSYFSRIGADAVSRAATISLSTKDGSVNQRLRYYEDVLTHMSSNPIFWCRSWKLEVKIH